MADTSSGPSWARTLDAWLRFRPQVVLSGNVRDVFVLESAGADTQANAVPLPEFLGRAIPYLAGKEQIVFDPVAGFRGPDEVVGEWNRTFRAGTWREALRVAAPAIASSSNGLFLVVSSADRLLTNPTALSELDQAFFTYMESLSYWTVQVERSGSLSYNPIIWLCAGDRSLPAWFTAQNPRVGSVSVPLPTADERRTAVRLFLGGQPGEEPPADVVSALVDGSDGIPLLPVIDIAATNPRDADEASERTRAYKVGFRDNPWRQETVRRKLLEWEEGELLQKEIFGQDAALTKATDLLKRSVLGLSGAHLPTASTRPRGVLFLAGPTGVGKTELARQLAKLVFGKEARPRTFDMSEFSAEHAADRLIGAPPGYIGHEAGGELTDAVRRNPFLLLLFDEIEKAHPRILDKFLQVLDEGRLTDGRGQTVFFSEAFLVFTSNLGIMKRVTRRADDGTTTTTLEKNVEPGMKPREVEEKILDAINETFDRELNRPELRNRFGDNMVVFQFIDAEAGRKILEKFLRQVTARVEAEVDLTLVLTPAALAQLEQICLADLSKGGRGIGNRLESALINPLARALFQWQGAGVVQVDGIDVDDSGLFSLRMSAPERSAAS